MVVSEESVAACSRPKDGEVLAVRRRGGCDGDVDPEELPTHFSLEADECEGRGRRQSSLLLSSMGGGALCSFLHGRLFFSLRRTGTFCGVERFRANQMVGARYWRGTYISERSQALY